MPQPKKAPKLRPDATVSQIETGIFEIANPATGQVLQVDSVGYHVAEQFESGEMQSPDEILEALYRNYSLKLTKREIHEFVEKANEVGLFEVDVLETSWPETSNEGESQSREDGLAFKPRSRLSIADEIERIKNTPFWKELNPKLVFFLGTAFVLFFLPWRTNAGGEITIESKTAIAIRAPFDTRVEEVFVVEGDLVDESKLLLRLEGFEPEISKLEAELEKVDAELKMLVRGARVQEIEREKKRVEQAEKLMEQAQKKMNRYAVLREKGLISQEDWDDIVSEVEIKTKDYEAARAGFELMAEGNRVEIIEAKRAEKNVVLIDLDLLRRHQENTLIRSSYQGVVAGKNLQRLVGKGVKVGEVLFEVVDPQALQVELLIRETDIGIIKNGKELTFKVQSFPQETFKGKVIRISPVAEPVGLESAATGASFFRVYCDISASAEILRPGMTGYGQVKGGRRPLGLNWFGHFIRTIRVRYVF